MRNDLLRGLPKLDVLLAFPTLSDMEQRFPHALVKEAAQSYIDALRAGLISGSYTAVPAIGDIAGAVVRKLETGDLFALKRVINATGVVLHTNLGRAPLGREAAEHIASVAAGYCNLEYDLGAGVRGSRYDHVEKLLCELTGAEAAMAVNNNAGAVFLMLNTLAKGQKVAISRGELVEIGGSFRVPEIMEQSGAELMEIGTTNKTHLADYRAAVEAGASVLLKVHTSNFVMSGFTESAEIGELSPLAKESGTLLLYDLGSGFMFPSETLGLHVGQSAGKCLKDGADIVCFSGDKLLGSAQAGIIVGKRELIEKIKKNHLTRMLRIDKLSLAALEMALRYSKDPALARERVPALHMLSKTEEECREDAYKLEKLIGATAPGAQTQVVMTEDEAGGGSLPGVTLPGAAVALTMPGFSPVELEARLRGLSVPIITRISRECVLISTRTLCGGDGDEIAEALAGLEEGTK